MTCDIEKKQLENIISQTQEKNQTLLLEANQ